MNGPVNTAEIHARFESVLGGICAPKENRGAEDLVEVQATGGDFEKLLKHWRELPLSARPQLRGLTMARRSGKYFELLLDAGPRTPFILLTVDWTGSRPLPAVADLWPYAEWWEDELRSFEGAEIERAPGAATGISWRRN